MDTSAQLFRQIGILADDEPILKKILKFVNDLIISKKSNFNEDVYKSEKDILNDLYMAMEEAEQYKKGEKTLTTWDEFKQELENEGYL